MIIAKLEGELSLNRDKFYYIDLEKCNINLQRLIKKSRSQGIGKRKLMEMLGFKMSKINKVISDEAPATLKQIYQIIDNTNITLDYLLSDNGDIPDLKTKQGYTTEDFVASFGYINGRLIFKEEATEIYKFLVDTYLEGFLYRIVHIFPQYRKRSTPAIKDSGIDYSFFLQFSTIFNLRDKSSYDRFITNYKETLEKLKATKYDNLETGTIYERETKRKPRATAKEKAATKKAREIIGRLEKYPNDSNAYAYTTIKKDKIFGCPENTFMVGEKTDHFSKTSFYIIEYQNKKRLAYIVKRPDYYTVTTEDISLKLTSLDEIKFIARLEEKHSYIVVDGYLCQYVYDEE